ncbi:conserved protein of unknown function [Tepidanaerobacter acetatoxydans Re1]|uniref:Uncharacterized protein n=1 Tax=Tepidanaerobacter acetatoxydans (strain DSM 21804 / JCM 16047 / Re1) TaxID=1209989 RepID=F4LRV3_TEPAE|nr:hypothetical protein [Tepidanaerobacter acetatoxydans]AEE91171.1 hypothetical protein TepRe1_1023 [Tepidanaerobacter acetatoxydans Re1]CCP25842.1 conserved protein of unknown function [Tepidanaerobacter acetatoxydans Re1]
MEELKMISTEELVKELKNRGKELSVEKILYDQLVQLRELSKSELVKNEPELVVKISLAMGEIAKGYLL